ncbi:MAG: PEP-CTERM sorting domain-containing protein [Phycisphaerae bacterium]
MRTSVILLAAAVLLLVGGMTAQAGMISGTLGNSGWLVNGISSGSVGIAVDNEGTDNDGRKFVAIEVIKVFNQGPDPQNGSIPPIILNFIQTGVTAAPATRIYIADEIITNLTGVRWTDFHWILGTTDTARFNRDMTNPTNNPDKTGWQIGPFTTANWSADPNLGTETLSVSGGDGVANQSSFFPGTGYGNLVIDVNTDGRSSSVFTLKEIPTTIPEPASLALLGLGGVMVILRRRARRS